MASLKQFLPGVAKNPQDIVCVHAAHDGIYCVRMRKNGTETIVTAADVLPAPAGDNDDAGSRGALSLPKNLKARYVAICVPGEDAMVKLLNLPGQLGADAEEHIRENMGVGDGDYRVGYRVLGTTRQSRSETRVLTVALPEAQAQEACAMFPAGIPAPISIEIGGLAVMTAFHFGPAAQHTDEAVACIDTDEKVSFVAIFLKGELLLVRKIDFGHADLLSRIQQNLGVDQETARKILVDGSFDVSQMVKSVMEPFVKQLVISKHFIERRENCHLSRMFLPQGMRMAREWVREIKSGVGVEVDFWNPLDVVNLPEGVLKPELDKQKAGFAAAIGAGLGLFAEKAS